MKPVTLDTIKKDLRTAAYVERLMPPVRPPRYRCCMQVFSVPMRNDDLFGLVVFIIKWEGESLWKKKNIVLNGQLQV